MTRRTERIGKLIQDVIGELLLSKISDPRIDPARTSVTRVEVMEDLLTARVYVSIMGTDTQQRAAVRALQHASGHIQELMMRRIELRCTPRLTFELDVNFKKTLKTFELIQKAMDEIRAKDEARSQTPPREGEKPNER
jgi:ribosome-binding factor A